MCRPLVLAVAAAVAVLAAPAAAADTACPCPEPDTQHDFQADQYIGDWYEMKRVPRSFEDDGQCGMAHYTWTDTTKTAINVLNTNYVPKNAVVSEVTLRAEADDIANGKLKVSFPGLQRPASKYWVLGTDYDTYAVVYSCSDASSTALTPHITLWVLSRDPAKYTADVNTKAMAVIDKAGLDSSILKDVDHHQGCPTTSCRACSSTLSALDLAKLKGRWWEVQHSPYSTGSDTQSCSMAEFAATSEGLNFTATTYEMSSATAGVDVTMLLEAKWSDAAKKDGAFNIKNSDGKLCVLGTDYDNWAVVSICLPRTSATTVAPGPFAVTSSAASGGVFVLARRRGLGAKQQTEANKAVTNAGVPAAAMEITKTTPCPAAALVDDNANAATALAPSVVLLSAVAAILGPLRPPQ